MQQVYKINHIAIFILAVFHLLFSAFWYYSSSFGIKRFELLKISTESLDPANITPYLLWIIASLCLCYAISWLFLKLNVDNALKGFQYALLFWVGFFFFTLWSEHAISQYPFKVLLIDSLKELVVFTTASLVLSTWRKKEFRRR